MDIIIYYCNNILNNLFLITDLENVKHNTTANKRRKTKVQQATSVSKTAEGDIAPSTLTKKPSEKRSTAKRGSRKYQDPEVQIFQKIPGADDGNIK